MIQDVKMGGSPLNIKFDRDTKLYVSASSNPGNRGTSFYNYLFNLRSINAIYLPRKSENAKELVSALRALKIDGCSVSMPLKSEVLGELDRVDPLALRLKSVNTIVRTDQGLTGYNTDYFGFCQPLLKRGLKPLRVALYGYGSVAGTIVVALKEQFQGVEVFVAGRDFDKVGQFIIYNGLKKVEESLDFDLLVNATPSSHAPSADLLELVGRSKAVYDLVVSDASTSLSDISTKRGRQVIQGSEMFCFQFLKQFELYTGQTITLSDFNAAANQLGFLPVAE